MKYIVLLTLILLAQVSVHAQTNITFADANFKQALLDRTPKIDTNNDGEISTTEAGNATGTLDVRNKSIANIAGIEYFTSLDKLFCSQNSLTNLNVSALTNLNDLRCSYNDLNSLDVSALTNLTNLSCRDNDLTNLDVSGLTELQYLTCESNNLTSLILGGQTNMTQLICAYNNLTSLDLRNISLEKIHAAANRCLQCVIVDDVNDVPQNVSGTTPPPYTEEPWKLPVITCKNYTVKLNGTGNASITAVNVLSGRSSDICGFSSMSVSPSSFTCADVGENEVTLTVNDTYGNTNTCKAIVTVEDKVKPDAKCKNITIQLNASGNASISESDVDDGSSDACGIASMSVSPSSFTCADVGDNEVTLTVKDIYGNTSTCMATVTVEDIQDPIAECRDFTVQLDASGNVSVPSGEINNGSSDDCGIESMSISPSSFTCADVGDNEVTLTVRDKSGNESTCTAMVTVEDKVKPDAKCQDIIVQLDASGNASISATDVDDGSSDACGIESMSVSPSSFTCADVGDNEVTLTVRDKSGNESSCTATVTVEDKVKPNVICQNITVQLNGSGNTAVTASEVDNGSSDACGIESMSVSPSAFTIENLGENEVTLTVRDKSGNESNCNVIVTVEDNVKPDAKCQDIIVQLDAYGNVSISASDVDNGSSDASGIESMSVSPSFFTCTDVGETINVTLTVTDYSGNISTCISSVTVVDNIHPKVRLRNQTVFLNKYGKAAITPAMIDKGSTDNCTINSVWLEGQTDYDCGDVGEHEVVLKVRDRSGNIAQSVAIVTVKFFKPDFESMLGIAEGDTLHQVNCQVPREVTLSSEDLAIIKTYGKLRTTVSKVDLPEDAPWGQYAVWRTDFVMRDACAHTFRFSFYQALYDLAPPVFQFIPPDTTVATIANVPEVDREVKILDVCQYVVWDTVITFPFINPEAGDTIGFTRRWIAWDPSGHESFRDQMIWIESSHQDQYGLIQGRISDESHVLNSRFRGEAGTNGIPVSLYRIEDHTGSRTKVRESVTGDRMGACGTYYFVPVLPGRYQVKIDSMICLVDTVRFNKDLWSDTLVLSPGESIDPGWVLTQSCPEEKQVEPVIENIGADETTESLSFTQNAGHPIINEPSWSLFPNPSSGYLHIAMGHDDHLEYRVYNALGRIVKSGLYHRGGTINIHKLPSGVYHVRLYSEATGRQDIKKVLVME